MRECLLDSKYQNELNGNEYWHDSHAQKQKAPYGVYPIDMLHIVRTQFDDTTGLTTSNSGEMDDQGNNDAKEAKQTNEKPLNWKNNANPSNKVHRLHALHQ